MPDTHSLDESRLPVRTFSYSGNYDFFQRSLIGRVEKILGEASDYGLEPDHLTDLGALFFARTRAGLSPTIDLGGERTFTTQQSTGANGHLRTTLEIPRELLEENITRSDHPGERWVQFEARDEVRGQRAVGKAQLLTPEGTLVVMDVDDTIKDSAVTPGESLNRLAVVAKALFPGMPLLQFPDQLAETLRKTLYHTWEAIDGMPELCSDWHRQGASFAYLSSMPFQLHKRLSTFLQERGFPEGSQHLKPFRWRDIPFKSREGNPFSQPRIGKGKALRELLDRFPRRKVILVGDAKEDDPKIYADTASDPRYADRISKIAIRLVSRKNNLDEQRDRCERAFRDLPPSMWTLFERGQHLSHDLDQFSSQDQ